MRSEERREGKSVDLGGRRIIKKNFFKQKTAYEIYEFVTGVQTCALPILDEYPHQTRRYVLNGSIIGSMGLYDHWWVFGDDLSAKLFSCEMSTIKDNVLLYRNPSELSAYCLL